MASTSSRKDVEILFDGFIPEKTFDVLAHGDCWNNNFLFRYDENDIPIDVRFVDLQCSRKASPATDILYFFYTSLSGDFRVEKMNYMVSIYYKSFCEVLSRAEKSPPFSYEELILEVKNRRIFGLSVGVLVLSVVLSEDTDTLYDKTLPDNCSEGQNKSVKAFLDSENPLQKRLLSMFDEFIEYDLFN
ncbi:hypothetical protein Avbf_03275 [Armadillidium vulgare]|nr:hypothetical protein Avbf_03275 [Armadillidium vulgare]